MSVQSLEAKFQALGDPAVAVRNAPAIKYVFPILSEYTNWQDEQRAWKETAVLYDQSHHMTDIYFKGPDVKRLFNEIGPANFDAFGRNKAKQFLATSYDGYIIADAIAFGIDDDEINLVGTPVAPNWVAYQAEAGNYDVEVTRDDHSFFGGGKPRLTFRYQINGPLTREIVEKAQGKPLDRIKFFQIGEFTIAGHPVRALNHTMAGVPGREMTGLEIFGDAAAGPEVLAALIEAGREFGLRQGGARSYQSATYESGWIPSPLPAIYTGEKMKPYREHLTVQTLEANASVGGSFRADNIEDYYFTPWDLGYGRLLKFDHDFIGRDALVELEKQPHRKKVFLRWNDDDVARVASSNIIEGDKGPHRLDYPNANFNHFQYDQVLRDDKMIGVSTYAGYTVNMGALVSLASIDEAEAQDGAEVTLIWGEPEGGSRMFGEPHTQTNVRATIHTDRLV